MVVLPECFGFISPKRGASLGAMEPIIGGYLARECGRMARDWSVWIIAGGMHEQPQIDAPGMEMQCSAWGRDACSRHSPAELEAAQNQLDRLVQLPESDARTETYDGGAIPSRTRCFNTQLVFDPRGKLQAAYRKIHLFDLDPAASTYGRPSIADTPMMGVESPVSRMGSGRMGQGAGRATPAFIEAGTDMPRLGESTTTAPGSAMVALDAGALGRVGLSTCYDVRFPKHFAALREAGCELLTVPSAFTVPTGAAHWELLLRARAVETQCYVLAAAQAGSHASSEEPSITPRQSWGHAMIVSPWGDVIAQAPRDGRPGVVIAEIDLPWLRDEVRTRMPLLEHLRTDVYRMPVCLVPSSGRTHHSHMVTDAARTASPAAREEPDLGMNDATDIDEAIQLTHAYRDAAIHGRRNHNVGAGGGSGFRRGSASRQILEESPMRGIDVSRAEPQRPFNGALVPDDAESIASILAALRHNKQMFESSIQPRSRYHPVGYEERRWA